MKAVCNLGGRMHMPRGYYGNVVGIVKSMSLGEGSRGEWELMNT